MRRGLSLLALALTGVVSASAHAATPAACGKLVPPAQGVYFGAAPGYANESDYYPGPADGFDQQAGLTAAWTMVGEWWSAMLPFPTKTVQSIWQDGKVPFIRLNPYPEQPLDINFDGMPPGPFTLEDIAAGKYDAQLRAWADTARNLDIPILAEFGTEENNYFPWSPRNNGKGVSTAYGDPTYPDGAERFRDAFRRVVTVTRGEGATNITWFFHADTVYYKGPEPWNELHWAYPGDDYIDWLGLSLYAYPKSPGTGYTSFAEKLQTYHNPGYVGSYAELTSLSSRPLALTEIGFNRVPVEARVPWVTDAAATVESGAFPRLAGLTWYVTSAVDFNSLVNASPEFQASFRAAFDDPFFAAKPQFTGSCAPSAPRKVTLKNGTLTWSRVLNAATYEVWRGSKKLATRSYPSLDVPRRGLYRVRATNLAGASAFTPAR